MKAVLFGATGMIGQGVLRECLLDPDVTEVLSIGRRPIGTAYPKLRDIVHDDLLDLAPIESQLAGYDACFYCLGSTSVGMTEAEYTRVTYDVAMAAATALSRQSPAMTFVFISGRATDASEQGKTMWARVKGKTENAIASLPFKAAYMFRPGYIQPVHGEKSRTRWTRNTYLLAGWLYPLWKLLFPNHVTRQRGRRPGNRGPARLTEAALSAERALVLLMPSNESCHRDRRRAADQRGPGALDGDA